jgi:hypothetical protein
MPIFQYFLHIDIHACTAHVASLQLGQQGNPIGSHMLTYPDSYEIEDFLADAINESHSDTSGMLQAIEMQGEDHFWLELTHEEHTAVRDQVQPMNVGPVESHGLRYSPHRVFVLASETEMDLSAQLRA